MSESFVGDDYFDSDLCASEEIIYLDRAIEKSKKIQSSLESTINQIEKLRSKYEDSANSYFYNFTPSKTITRECARAEYLIYSIYDIHLTKLCQRLNLVSSPQRLQQKFRRLTYVPSSCSSSPSASSTEHLATEEDADEANNNNDDGRKGYRSHKDVLKVYNKMKTEKIKSNREISAALMSLDKALSLSTTRATEAKNYAWTKEKLKMPKRNSTLNYRRSISSSMCSRAKHSTPIQIKRPLSTSVIF